MNKYAYFLFIPFHIALLAGVLNFWSQFEWWHALLLFAFWTLFSGFGIGIGFHRLLAHRSFRTSKFWEHACSILGCFGIQGSPLFWVALHRGTHHPYADQFLDIHSPMQGNFQSYMGWALTINMDKINARAVKDLFLDPFQVQLHKHYFFLVVLTIAAFAVISPSITALCLLPAMAITLHQEFCVNLFCHRKTAFSYRTFDTKDNSHNIYLFGLLCWGVGYHNNHHFAPNEYDFGYALGTEIDFTKYLVRLIKR